jgi:Fe-S-cluster containining protein
MEAKMPFERTICACPQDVAYCKTKPGPLIPSDLKPIGDRLVELGRIQRPEEVAQFLQASPGATVGDLRTRTAFQIPTITPAQHSSGRCVFLNWEDRCDIHAVAPAGCRFFDAHLSREDGDVRSLWMHREIARSHAYQALRSILPEKREQ